MWGRVASDATKERGGELMAISYTCDGCSKPMPEGEAHKHGGLAPAYYCAACDAAWRAHLERETAERTRLVEEFEAWRKAARATLREGGLRRLPDE